MGGPAPPASFWRHSQHPLGPRHCPLVPRPVPEADPGWPPLSTCLGPPWLALQHPSSWGPAPGQGLSGTAGLGPATPPALLPPIPSWARRLGPVPHLQPPEISGPGPEPPGLRPLAPWGGPGPAQPSWASSQGRAAPPRHSPAPVPPCTRMGCRAGASPYAGGQPGRAGWALRTPRPSPPHPAGSACPGQGLVVGEQEPEQIAGSGASQGWRDLNEPLGPSQHPQAVPPWGGAQSP